MKRIGLVSMLFASLALSPACKKDKKDGGEKPEKEAEAVPEETPEEQPEEQPAAGGLADLGLVNQQNPAEHVATGGQLTEEHIAKAKEAGVKHVVNVRSEAEKDDYADEETWVTEAGMSYVHMPIVGSTGEGLNADNAKKLHELIGKNEPMIVHCKSGNRVGALYAAMAVHVDGKTIDEGIEVAKQAGLTSPDLEKVTREVLAKKE